MIMMSRRHVHILAWGRKHRPAAKGDERRLHLHILISPRLQLALMNEAARNHETVAAVVEELLWRELGRIAARKGARLVERLRHANALINEIVAFYLTIQIAGEVTVPGQKPPANIHEKEFRRERRNRISEKTVAAFDEVYDLAQMEALAKDNRTRATMYLVLARLAEVNELLLRDASQEEVLVEIEKLREDQERFEEATRKLEEETKDSAATKQASPAA